MTLSSHGSHGMACSGIKCLKQQLLVLVVGQMSIGYQTQRAGTGTISLALGLHSSLSLSLFLLLSLSLSLSLSLLAHSLFLVWYRDIVVCNFL